MYRNRLVDGVRLFRNFSNTEMDNGIEDTVQSLWGY